ncbi:hypothetical protein NIES4071_43350 [Calothrix sp. NIES-4071]|nr:hypothetical protein NIES4071_43350 [Calothrix sp. NIES-4071]BAZ58649.1 hypothetical protein NIES4105_43280 [Calothrix sp. NIES-4105]
MNKAIAKVTHLVRLAAIGTAATSLSLVGAVPPSLAAPAPTCVSTRRSTGRASQTVRVTNDCKTTQRVKVLWAFGFDSACNTLAPGTSFSHTVVGRSPRFDGLKKC